MSGDTTYALFLDTMTYLHYTPVDQIDWHDVLGVPRDCVVQIVVPGITLREIDKHKNHSPRLRDCARRVGKQLSTWLSNGTQEIRTGVQIVRAVGVPRIDFDAEDLDKTINDDVLVAAALWYQRTNPDVTVVVVTQDPYPQVVAGARGIAVQPLPDYLKLSEEEDSLEKENRELKRQLQKLQFARPDLTLAFAGGTKSTREVFIPSVKALTEDELVKAVSAMERKYPPANSFRPRPAAAAAKSSDEDRARPDGVSLSALVRDAERAREWQAAYDPQEIERYAAKRSQFLKEYAEYARAQREFERARARHFSLEIEVVNNGTTPASDVDIRLHVPDGVLVADEDDLQEPELPTPPALPQTGAERLAAGFASLRVPGVSLSSYSYLPPSPHHMLARAPRNVSSLDIKETNSYLVTCHVGRVKHGLRESLPTMYVTVPSSASIRPFQITYTLHAANLAEPVTGTLTVLLKPGPPADDAAV